MFQSIELFGSSIKLYDLINTLGDIAMLVLAVVFLKDFVQISTLPKAISLHTGGVKKRDFPHYYILFILEILLLKLISSVTVGPLASALSTVFLKTTDPNYFVNIIPFPFVGFLVFVLFKISPLKAFDYMAPVTCVTLIFYKIACFCEGCCYGVETEHGLFNHNTGRTEFPVQLIEFACAAVMLTVLLILYKKKKRPGTLYPLFMLMYSGGRFCSDFLRDDYPRILGKMTGYHIQCLIGIVLGAVFYAVAYRYGERISAFFESRDKAFLDKRIAAYEKAHPQIVHRKKK